MVRGEFLMRGLRSPRALAGAALLIAFLTLLLSATGAAWAKAPTDKDEVQVLTTATGSFTSPVTAGDAVALTNASFVQPAGSTILVLFRLDGDLPEDPVANPCSFSVFLGAGAVGAELEITNGGFHTPFALEGVIPTEADVARTVEAAVSSAECETSGVTVDVTVEVVALY